MKTNSYGICPYKIVDSKIYILVNKTGPDSKYNFFKGKIEESETIVECANREFEEEAGIDLSDVYKEEYFSQTSKRKDIGVFLVQVDDLKPGYCDEIYSWHWLELEADIIFSKNQKKIFGDIFLFLKSRIDFLRVNF